ncbi:MAG: hypothetical protein EOP73_17175 [Variovorax sp.]|jgi:hypothetical protein|nr:MAG: hypothetical protein EOP73_17175 [Variovorax sp.]
MKNMAGHDDPDIPARGAPFSLVAFRQARRPDAPKARGSHASVVPRRSHGAAMRDVPSPPAASPVRVGAPASSRVAASDDRPLRLAPPPAGPGWRTGNCRRSIAGREMAGRSESRALLEFELPPPGHAPQFTRPIEPVAPGLDVHALRRLPAFDADPVRPLRGDPGGVHRGERAPRRPTRSAA